MLDTMQHASSVRDMSNPAELVLYRIPNFWHQLLQSSISCVTFNHISARNIIGHIVENGYFGGFSDRTDETIIVAAKISLVPSI